MKKTYIMPNCKYAELDNFELIAQSEIKKIETPIEGEVDILSRDQDKTGSSSLWDSEW